MSTPEQALGDDVAVPKTDASSQSNKKRHTPGPKREGTAPVGPEAVTEAILEAAATLFAESGVDHVSLRDIANAANVQLTLIGRYVGTREMLIDTVFRRANAAVVVDLVANPLARLASGRDSSIGRWLALLTHYSTIGKPPPTDGINPIRSLADIFEERFGLDRRTARLRSAQVAASTFGWRIFEDYLLDSAEIHDLDNEALREDLNAIQRHIGSTPWPTPPVA
jgi:AcrR family transcriptional regulator